MEEYKEVGEKMTEAIACSIIHYDLKRWPEPWELEVMIRFMKKNGWSQSYKLVGFKAPSNILFQKRTSN